jgi:hypothetical protein
MNHHHKCLAAAAQSVTQSVTQSAIPRTAEVMMPSHDNLHDTFVGQALL